jgi:hypothetical protein
MTADATSVNPNHRLSFPGGDRTARTVSFGGPHMPPTPSDALVVGVDDATAWCRERIPCVLTVGPFALIGDDSIRQGTPAPTAGRGQLHR